MLWDLGGCGGRRPGRPAACLEAAAATAFAPRPVGAASRGAPAKAAEADDVAAVGEQVLVDLVRVELDWLEAAFEVFDDGEVPEQVTEGVPEAVGGVADEAAARAALLGAEPEQLEALLVVLLDGLAGRAS